MMRRRVVAFFQHMPPYSGAAGLRGASVMSALANRLGRDCAVHVFTTTRSPDALGQVTVSTINAPEVENSQGLFSRVVGEIRIGIGAAFAISALNPRADAVIISTPGYIAALLLSAFTRVRGQRYIIELRDVYPQVYIQSGLIAANSLLAKFFCFCSKQMYGGAALVVAATNGLQREVLGNCATAKVHTVYNGFPDDFLVRSFVKYPKFSVCFHGILGFFQDVPTLLKVAEALEFFGIEVVVIGYGRGADILRESKLSNLRFLGRLSYDETVSQIERCHVGLCLRYGDEVSKDAFPVKIWEYIGLGIPCVVTPHCEAGYFVAAHECGVQKNAGDVDGIVEAILRYRDSPALLALAVGQCLSVRGSYTRSQTGCQASRLIAEAIEEDSPHLD